MSEKKSTLIKASQAGAGTLVRVVEPNDCGRDFVVGDLHGCVDLLYEEMDRAEFNPVKDRIFSVGDLADRGPKSLESLRLLNEPWFFAVRGNHEDMLLSAFDLFDSDYHAPDSIILNGGLWAVDAIRDHESEMRSLLAKIAQLPYVNCVLNQERTGFAFNVAHAELISPRHGNPDSSIDNSRHRETLNDQDLLILSTVSLSDKSPLTRNFQAVSTWGRRLVKRWETAIKGEYSEKINAKAFPKVLCHGSEHAFISSSTPEKEGLSLTFVGHTVLPVLALHDSHFFLDRGAFKRELDGEQKFSLAFIDAIGTAGWLHQEKQRSQYRAFRNRP